MATSYNAHVILSWKELCLDEDLMRIFFIYKKLQNFSKWVYFSKRVYFRKDILFLSKELNNNVI